jgi:hypothetical protein
MGLVETTVMCTNLQVHINCMLSEDSTSSKVQCSLQATLLEVMDLLLTYH